MNDSMNILILSCGARNKIVKYFKKELGDKGQVMATDCSELAPALYDANKHFIVPRLNEAGYEDAIFNICKKNRIKGVLSLIDPELSFLAKNKDKFLDIGTIPIVSNYETVETCFDKFKFYQYITKCGFRTILSYVDKDLFFKDQKEGLISYPVFVKPIKGSASNGVNILNNREEVEFFYKRFDSLLIQEYMSGPEIGVDAYVDIFSRKIISIFTKRKISMRAGETDKSVSFKDENLFKLITSFIDKIGFIGVIDIDIFKKNGEYIISEVNPRFGGGYPHAYECGVNMPKMILSNLENKENRDIIGQYDEDIYMMKFNDLKIIGNK